jgi:hypothetical protein
MIWWPKIEENLGASRKRVIAGMLEVDTRMRWRTEVNSWDSPWGRVLMCRRRGLDERWVNDDE